MQKLRITLPGTFPVFGGFVVKIGRFWETLGLVFTDVSISRVTVVGWTAVCGVVVDVESCCVVLLVVASGRVDSSSILQKNAMIC